MRRYLLSIMLTLTACSSLPQDPAGTLQRVRRGHVIRVGHVAGASAADDRLWRQVLQRVSQRTGARPEFHSGALEPLLLELEAGHLDLVVGGRFDEETPWKPRVALGEPIGTMETAGGRTAMHMVARNGENAWITLVQRELRATEGADD